jgi:hypothetical protein
MLGFSVVDKVNKGPGRSEVQNWWLVVGGLPTFHIQLHDQTSSILQLQTARGPQHINVYNDHNNHAQQKECPSFAAYRKMTRM